MTTPATSLNELKQRRTEWAPWLAVIEEVLRETESSEWDSVFSPAAQLSAAAQSANKADDHRPAIPLLAGATLTVRRIAISRLLKRLIRTAVASGAPTMATLAFAVDRELDFLGLFKASLCQNAEYLEAVATCRGVDAGAFQAVVGLVSMPFLQACGRRAKLSISRSWAQPYCPVCGSWPVFAEDRGIERSRNFRCGRCGGEWYARGLACVYCGLSDHDALVALVPEKGRAHGVVEACTRCLGYMKVLTRLQGCAPATVLLDDLATVALDVAARSAGFTRPSGGGFPLDVTVCEPRVTRRLFAWNA
jgi:FdhE protein